ncbi:MAG: hypothetical protein WCT77_10935, partial [Bacteroidota bacterium]
VEVYLRGYDELNGMLYYYNNNKLFRSNGINTSEFTFKNIDDPQIFAFLKTKSEVPIFTNDGFGIYNLNNDNYRTVFNFNDFENYDIGLDFTFSPDGEYLFIPGYDLCHNINFYFVSRTGVKLKKLSSGFNTKNNKLKQIRLSNKWD